MEEALKEYVAQISQDETPPCVLHDSRPNLRTPPGLQAIITYLTCEILREQPDDIYAFTSLLLDEMQRKGKLIRNRTQIGRTFFDGRIILFIFLCKQW